MLATLNLLSLDAGTAVQAGQSEQRLPALYPQVLAVERRERDAPWPGAAQQQAAATSRHLGRAVLADIQPELGSYRLIQAGEPVSHALRIDLHRLMPAAPDWADSSDGAARLTLRLGQAGPPQQQQQTEQQQAEHVLQPGRPARWAWHVTLHKPLASASQPFELVAERWFGAADLPWLAAAAWLLLCAALLAGLHAWRRQRLGRQRAEELLRLGQVARLNTLGELAAGMAHELNQPLTAVLASTQAALRVLADDPHDPHEPPDVDLLRQAMQHAVAQASRASEVLRRLRRMVERPDSAAQAQPLSLADAVRDALQLLEPELRARAVTLQLTGLDDAPGSDGRGSSNSSDRSASSPPGPEPQVMADPVALQQVVHNLVMNALQALEQMPAGARELAIGVGTRPARQATAPAGQGTSGIALPRVGVIEVRDNGPGIPPDALPRLFEPFFTTRNGGLGLGLSLCETLVTAMGGRLDAANRPHQRGAVFTLSLPLLSPSPSA
jgi:signal transduction histidine kinase